MDRGRPDRIEEVASAQSGQSAECDRGEWHSKGRQSNARDRFLEVIRNERERVEIRGLALIRAHPGRGVTLDVFDGAEAFKVCKLEVGESYVVLEIHKSFVARHLARRRWDWTSVRARSSFHSEAAPARRASAAGSRFAGGIAILEAFEEGQYAPTASGRALALGRLLRQKSFERFVVAELPPGLREEVNGRGPAATH